MLLFLTQLADIKKLLTHSISHIIAVGLIFIYDFLLSRTKRMVVWYPILVLCVGWNIVMAMGHGWSVTWVMGHERFHL